MTAEPRADRRGDAPALDGALVVDKPEGPTSHDVVSRARRVLRTRQIGHTGTLDPMATGVLVLVVGRATRLAQFLSGHEKQYVADIRLGVATDSWDRTGMVVGSLAPGDALPGAAEIAAAVESFLGLQDQVPPPFSAKKLAGVPAYTLARAGRAPEMTAARVALHSVVLESFEPPVARVRLTCSAGFYVRALADSLGRRLGCGGCLDALRRTASGQFSAEGATPLGELEQAPERAIERLVPLERMLAGMPAVTLTPDAVTRARHGNDVGPGDWMMVEAGGGRREAEGASSPSALRPTPCAFVQLLSGDGRLVAVARPAGLPGVLHPAVVLG